MCRVMWGSVCILVSKEWATKLVFNIVRHWQCPSGWTVYFVNLTHTLWYQPSVRFRPEARSQTHCTSVVMLVSSFLSRLHTTLDKSFSNVQEIYNSKCGPLLGQSGHKLCSSAINIQIQNCGKPIPQCITTRTFKADETIGGCFQTIEKDLVLVAAYPTGQLGKYSYCLYHLL